MQKFTSANLWGEIAAIAIKSKVKKAAISYVTTDDEIKFSEGDLLIVDATDHAIKTGQTSAQVLDRALRECFINRESRVSLENGQIHPNLPDRLEV